MLGTSTDRSTTPARGQLAAEGYGAGRDSDDISAIWSCTKSWVSLLVGMVVDDGLLSLDDTLGDVWPDQSVWKDVVDASIKQAVTIDSLLSMTSVRRHLSQTHPRVPSHTHNPTLGRASAT